MKKTLFLLFSVLLLVACGKEEKQQPAVISVANEAVDDDLVWLTKGQFDAANMEIASMQQATFSSTIQATGSLVAAPGQQLSVHALFGGYIKQFDLIPGQFVRKGQLLFSLENPEYLQTQQEFLETQSQLEFLYDDFTRQQKLAADSVASRKKLLRAEADYKSAQVRHAALKKKLTLMHIDSDSLGPDNMRSFISVFAPESGIVEAVHIRRGMFLTASEPALDMTATGDLLVELVVFEKDLASLKEGQRVTFTTQQQAGKTFFAELFLIHRTVDENSRSAQAYGRILPGQAVRTFGPGMYLEASIQTDSVRVNALPEEALVSVDDHFEVLVQKQGEEGNLVFEKQTIIPGLRGDDLVEVRNAEDFESGARFLVKGAFGLISE
ncbi:MAG: efflux RND transporter periplasmic adaptor subunit [Bacteroidia bacterium]